MSALQAEKEALVAGNQELSEINQSLSARNAELETENERGRENWQNQKDTIEKLEAKLADMKNMKSKSSEQLAEVDEVRRNGPCKFIVISNYISKDARAPSQPTPLPAFHHATAEMEKSLGGAEEQAYQGHER